MADWQFVLELRDVYHEDEDIHKLAGIVVERLKALATEARTRSENDKRSPFRTIRLLAGKFAEMADTLEDDIVPMFEEVRDNEDQDVDDFDYCMSDLYDWADTRLDGSTWGGKKMCWVNTFSTPAKKV